MFRVWSRWVVVVLIVFFIHLPSLLSKSNEELESRLLWTHEFPGSLTSLKLTSGGLLHAVARSGDKIKMGKKKVWPEKRFLIDSSGRVVWSGDATTSALAADLKTLILLEFEGEDLFLKAIGPSGGEIWRSRVDGLPVSISASSPAQMIVYLSLPFESIDSSSASPSASNDAKLVALNLGTGGEKWKAPIGTIQGAPEDFGAELAIEEGSVWWAAGGRAVRINAGTGHVDWSASLETGAGAGSLWNVSGTGAWVARNGRVIGFRPESGPSWNREIRKGAIPNGLVLTSSGLVASFRDEKGVTVTLMDPSLGDPRWEKTGKGSSPTGIAVSGDRVVITSGESLIGYELGNGEEVFKKKIKKEHSQEMRVRPGHSGFPADGVDV